MRSNRVPKSFCEIKILIANVHFFQCLFFKNVKIEVLHIKKDNFELDTLIQQNFMKKAILLNLCLCLFFSLSQAQENKFLLGISLGLNQQKPIITKSNWEKQGLDELKNLDVHAGYGFQLGVSGFYELSDNFGIRLNPSLHFAESSLDFTEVLDKKTKFVFEDIGIQIPLALEWMASKNKYKPTISMGASYFKSFVYTEEKTPFALKTDDIAAQIAAGFKMNFSYFNIHPQLIYTSGMNNLEQINHNIYTRAIQTWKNQMITFQIIFEK